MSHHEDVQNLIDSYDRMLDAIRRQDQEKRTTYNKLTAQLRTHCMEIMDIHHAMTKLVMAFDPDGWKRIISERPSTMVPNLPTQHRDTVVIPSTGDIDSLNYDRIEQRIVRRILIDATECIRQKMRMGSHLVSHLAKIEEELENGTERYNQLRDIFHSLKSLQVAVPEEPAEEPDNRIVKAVSIEAYDQYVIHLMEKFEMSEEDAKEQASREGVVPIDPSESLNLSSRMDDLIRDVMVHTGEPYGHVVRRLQDELEELDT